MVAYGLNWILLVTVAARWAITHMQAGRASIQIILKLVTAAMILAVAVIEASRRREARKSAPPFRSLNPACTERRRAPLIKEADGHGYE